MTWNLAQKSIIIPFRSSLNMRMIGWKVINLWRLILEKPGFVKNCRIFRYLCYILIRSNFTCFSAVLSISFIKNDQVIRPEDFKTVFTFFIWPLICHRRWFGSEYKFHFFQFWPFLTKLKWKKNSNFLIGQPNDLKFGTEVYHNTLEVNLKYENDWMKGNESMKESSGKIQFLQKSQNFQILVHEFVFFSIFTSFKDVLSILFINNDKIFRPSEFKTVLTFFIGPLMCHRRSFKIPNPAIFSIFSGFRRKVPWKGWKLISKALEFYIYPDRCLPWNVTKFHDDTPNIPEFIR